MVNFNHWPGLPVTILHTLLETIVAILCTQQSACTGCRVWHAYTVGWLYYIKGGGIIIWLSDDFSLIMVATCTLILATYTVIETSQCISWLLMHYFQAELSFKETMRIMLSAGMEQVHIHYHAWLVIEIWMKPHFKGKLLAQNPCTLESSYTLGCRTIHPGHIEKHSACGRKNTP